MRLIALATLPSLSLLAEKVLIQPFELDGAIAAHANSVLDHEIGEFLAINQNDALSEMFDVVARRLAEGGRRRKDTLGRLPLGKPAMLSSTCIAAPCNNQADRA